jgi:hypothetical protein
MTILGQLLRYFDHLLVSLVWLIASGYSYGTCSPVVDAEHWKAGSTLGRSLRDLPRHVGLGLFTRLVNEARISCRNIGDPGDYYVVRERDDIMMVQHKLVRTSIKQS